MDEIRENDDLLVQDIEATRQEPEPPTPEATTEEKPTDTYRFYAEQPYGVVTPPLANTEQPKKKKSIWRSFAKCVAGAACFGLVAGGAFYGVQYGYHHLFEKDSEPIVDILPSEKEQEDNDTVNPTDKIQLSQTTTSPVGIGDASETVSEVVAKTMPAMVSVKALYTNTTYFFGQPYTEESEGGGSGIIVGSNENELLIATNHHVIAQAKLLQVVLADNTEHTVTVKASDEDADLAILALKKSDLSADTSEKIDIAVLGDSDNAKVGQMVIAIGNALGYGPSVTVGYLSAKDRDITIQGNQMNLLQTNAAINSGNSGGALLNTKGEVIGINNAKLSSTEIEGICFAIPISEATPILNDMMTMEILSDEEKGYLGVRVTNASDFGFPDGVYVSEVIKDGAAEAAGIYAGDIVTHVDGKAVSTTNQLINSVTSNRFGTTIELTIKRLNRGEFEEMTISVTLMQNPDIAKQRS